MKNKEKKKKLKDPQFGAKHTSSNYGIHTIGLNGLEAETSVKFFSEKKKKEDFS